MTRSKLLRLIALLCFLSLFSPPANAQNEVDPARVIIVFDASGSMAGQIEGRPKIDVAKEVVSNIVSGIDPSVELGLMAYGHRKKGDCADIELLVPPAPASSAKVLSAISALNPIGKTPLTAAVIEASGHLRYTEEKASVILVSDGEETCDKDPCEAARMLEAAGLDFTCHVIGFALKPGESVGLECLAKQTGGLYLSADTVAGLTDALQETLKQVMKPVSRLVAEPKLASGGPVIDGVTFKLLTADGAEVAAGAGGRWSLELPQPGQYQLLAVRDDKVLKFELEIASGETVTKEVVFTETGLKATAHEIEGGPAIEEGVAWTLFTSGSEDSRKQVAFSYDGRPFLRVDPGTYWLTAERDGALAEREVTIGDGAALEIQVILGSGSLKLAATAKAGEAPLAKDLSWEVLGEADAEGDRKSQAVSYEAQPTLNLPAGKYLVRVTHGSATAEGPVEITAGKKSELLLSLESGKVKASAVMEEGGEPLAADLAWAVFGEADLEGNRKQVAFSYDAQPTFSLPSGKFLVEVVQGSAKATKEITVASGTGSEIVMVLGAGKLRLVARSAEGAEPISANLAWNVRSTPDLEGNRKDVAFSYDANPTLSIPSGEYTVSVDWGAATMSKDVVIESGKLLETELVLNAGTLVADAVMGEGGTPVTEGLAWTLLSEADAEGNRKDSGFSYDAEPLFRNTAGKYLLKVTRGSATAEAEVEVAANRQAKVTLNLNAGVLKVTAAGEGLWTILSVPKDGEADPVDLGFSYDKEAKFYLPAGKVIVRRTHDEKKAEKEVEIGVNKLTELSLEAK
jgi:Ca-activated chloride channel family protein